MKEEEATVLHSGGQPAELNRSCAVLRILQGDDVGREFRLVHAEHVIGRDSEADICVPKGYVSRRHAAIEVVPSRGSAPSRYVLKDLGSKNKTYVNSDAVGEHDLKDGDKVVIGDTIFRFELLDELDLKFHKDIQRKIQYDDLTQLLTKEAFFVALESEIGRSRRESLPLTVMMLDIDFFKKVNDTYGHQTGDHVLRVLGLLLGSSLRSVDVFARYGGEEFAGYFPKMTKSEARIEADRVRKAIEETVMDYEGKELSITVSSGLAEFPGDGATPAELIGKADAALYRAKSEGRNRVCTA